MKKINKLLKNIITTFMFLVATFTCASAQTTFAPIHSEWHWKCTSDWDDGHVFFKKYQTTKDTLYQGKLCAKIEGRSIKTISFTNKIVDTTIEPPLYTYTNGDTVFYFNNNFNRFYPLYIFNVKVGDTVTYHVPYMVTGRSDTTFDVIIDSIKNLFIGGLPTKVIYSSTSPTSLFGLTPLYERIGTTSGGCHTYPIIGYNVQYGLPYQNFLTCYHDESISYPKIANCDSLDYQALIVSETYLEAQLKISPNPFNDLIQVEIRVVNYKDVSVEIYDMMGKKIQYESTWLNKSMLINTSLFKSGMYFIQVMNKNGAAIKTQKLIKNQ